MISLGIDCGTQSTKTVALDLETGRVLASAGKAYGFVPGLPDGAMEQDPEDWWAATEETVGDVLAQLGPRKAEVGGIGVSGQQHGLVVLDGAGEVVRPAKLWCDTSTAAQCGELTGKLGGANRVIELVGNAILPGYTASKIAWLREKEPANWARVRTLLLPHDFLNFRLTGVAHMEFGDASGTALLDVRAREWSAPVLTALGDDVAEKLPPVGSSLEPVGPLGESLRRQWGLPAGVVVSAGGGDNMMAAIGTGNTAPGIVTASLGTSGTLFAFAEQPVADPRGEVAAFCDSTDHWLPLVCTMNVTLVTERTRGLFRWSHEAFDAAVAGVPAGAEGLTFLPYLAGERTPNLPQGCGVLHGLTTENFTAAHFARAAMEGVTLGLGYGLERLRERGVGVSEIRLTGGGSRSATWRQICADVFGVPVVGLAGAEGGALGAAIQAGWQASRQAAGHSSTVADVAKSIVRLDPATRREPRAGAGEIHRGQLARMRGLREALTGVTLL